MYDQHVGGDALVGHGVAHAVRSAVALSRSRGRQHAALAAPAAVAAQGEAAAVRAVQQLQLAGRSAPGDGRVRRAPTGHTTLQCNAMQDKTRGALLPAELRQVDLRARVRQSSSAPLSGQHHLLLLLLQQLSLGLSLGGQAVGLLLGLLAAQQVLLQQRGQVVATRTTATTTMTVVGTAV